MTEQQQIMLNSLNDGKEVLQLQHCPVCQEENVFSQLKTLEFEYDSYWLECTNPECYYVEEFNGHAVVSKEDLILHGLPAQLLDHMVIYFKDVLKVLRVCMSECLKKKCTSKIKKEDLQALKDSVQYLADYHCTGNVLSRENCDITEEIQRVADKLVEKVPLSYQEEVKNAFSKIEGYNFPEQFGEDVDPSKLPLHKYLEEQEDGVNTDLVGRMNEFINSSWT